MRRTALTSAVQLAAMAAAATVRAAAGDDPFAAAARLYESRQWRAAAAAFDACANSPGASGDAAQVYAAECFAQLGDYAVVSQRLQPLLDGSEKLSERYRTQALFRAGEAAWMTGDATAARRRLEAYLAVAADRPAAVYAAAYLGEIVAAERDVLSPATDLQTVASRASATHSWRQLMGEAQDHRRVGRHDAALAAYRQAFDATTDSKQRVRTLLAMAELHRRLDHLREAARALERIIAEDSAGDYAPRARFGLARIHRDRGDDAGFRQLMQAIVAASPQAPEAPEAAYALAADAFERGDLPEGRRRLAWLDARLKSDENNENMAAAGRLDAQRSGELRRHTLWLASQLEAADQDWDAAAAMLDRLLADDPGELKRAAQFWRAEADYRRRDFAAALDRYQRLSLELERNPQLSQDGARGGTARRESAPMQESSTNATATNPSAGRSHLDRGDAAPWTAMIPLRIAQIYAHDEAWTDVLDMVDQLRRETPSAALAHEVNYLEGRARAGRGEMTAARAAYRRVLDDRRLAGSEAAARSQWMIGESYFHQRNFSAARDEYLAVLALDRPSPWRERAALQAGKCLELEGRWDEARTLYVESAGRFGGAPSTAELKARINWIDRVAVREGAGVASDAPASVPRRRK